MKRNLGFFLLFITCVGSSLSTIASKGRRRANYAMKDDAKRKDSSSLLKVVVPIGLVVVAVIGYSYLPGKKSASPITDEEINRALSVLKKHSDRVKVIKKHYEDGFFTLINTLINKSPDEVIITDGANAKLRGGEGTTGAIWNFVDKKCSGKRVVTNLDDTIRPLDENKKLSTITTALNPGDVVISTTKGFSIDNCNKQTLNVAHMLGVYKVNTVESRATNASGIKKILRFAQKKKKAVVFCVFSGGCFAKDNQMRKDMVANLLIAVADELEAFEKENQKLSIDIFFNDINFHTEKIKAGLEKSQIVNNALG